MTVADSLSPIKGSMAIGVTSAGISPSSSGASTGPILERQASATGALNRAAAPNQHNHASSQHMYTIEAILGLNNPNSNGITSFCLIL